ncbi:MAG: hypothetical protein QM764_02110 [Chitinophagaceae bacterium]
MVKLEERLDAGNYDEHQLTELKIPLNLPYYTDWAGYQSYSGEVEVNGENYYYVKRKIVGDTLFLLCIAHTEKDRIQEAKADYFKEVNGIAQTSQQKSKNVPLSIKLMLSKFLNDRTVYRFTQQEINQETIRTKSFLISQSNPLPPAQPPEARC